MLAKKTVIVTGGSGFIGTNMVRLLVNSGEYRVVNLDASPTPQIQPRWQIWEKARIMYL